MDKGKAVGIWIRVSTEDQARGESPEHHEKRARLYAEAKGWDVKIVYHLEAVSGKSVMGHPEAKKMLRDIKDGVITGLIFSKLARLARNTKELLDFADLFNNSKADLISLQEAIDTSTPAGRLFYTMIAAMAQWEREEIASRVAASVPIRAKLGKPLGGQASYGYSWQDRNLVLNEKEAPIRKLLYELFLKHRRKKTTAKALNEMGYRTRNGSKFSDTTVDRLIRDPNAKGEHRSNYTKSLGDGKQWELKPQSDWVINPCPPLVAEEIWNECNLILDDQLKKRKQVGPKAVHLLSGFLFCTCGKKMYVYHEGQNQNYACKTCKNRIEVSTIDHIYHTQLKAFLMTETDVETHLQKSDIAIAEKELLLKNMNNEAVKLKKQMDILVKMRMNEELSRESFIGQHKPLEERISQINDQIPEIEAEIDFLKIQYLSSDTILREAKDLYERWPSISFEEKRGIVEVITEKITIGKEDVAIKLSYLPSAFPEFAEKGNTSLFVRCYFPEWSNIVPRALPKKYPAHPQTIGEQLLKRRLDLKLFQKDVAKQLGVTTDCITLWEKGNTTPQVKHAPKIIQFLGFNPYVVEGQSLGARVKTYRYLNGLSHKKLGKILDMDGGTISRWETGVFIPDGQTQTRLEELLNK
jgi:site-specific DNA recombinase